MDPAPGSKWERGIPATDRTRPSPASPPSQTLTGRDIEHHLANASAVYYEDLVNGTVLWTPLGSPLLITTSREELSLVGETGRAGYGAAPRFLPCRVRAVTG